MSRFTWIPALTAVTLAACGSDANVAGQTPDTPPAAATAAPLDAPAGRYVLDRNHASLVFKVMHRGLSWYTARFTRFDVEADIDPAQLESTTVTATIDPRSIETDYPGEADFDTELATKPEYLDAENHPQMKFVSTSVRDRGDGTLEMTGDFTMHGVTQPVTLDVRINGAKPNLFSGVPTIGVSARGELVRSRWNVTGSLPETASDQVLFEIEAELKHTPAQ